LPACTDPEPSIPELEIDPANSHFSRDEKDSAFFIETSGSGSLSFRQSCAVESLAFHNPNLTVYVLFVNVQINSSVITLQKLRGKYGNIRLISINLDDYMAGTALEHWYHCIHWKKGPYHVNNLSNGLRLLTLAKYGGYYFDLDFVFVRSLIKYYRNFVAAQDNYDVNNGVIHAELKSPIIELAMTNFVDNFRYKAFVIWLNGSSNLCSKILFPRVSFIAHGYGDTTDQL
jgi:lactosylceramide 4-alpha-galactosyltransferase